MGKKLSGLAFIFAMIWTMLLTACGSAGITKNEPGKREEFHLVVILGNHNNAPKVNLGLIEGLVYQACLTYGKVTLICDDGSPYSCVIDIPEQKKGLTESKYISIANEQARKILEAASRTTARTE